MNRSPRTTDGLGSAGTLAVLAIVLQLWVAGAASARAEACDRSGNSIVHTIRDVADHAAPPLPGQMGESIREASERRLEIAAPNQPASVIRSGVWLTTVPPPATA